MLFLNLRIIRARAVVLLVSFRILPGVFSGFVVGARFGGRSHRVIYCQVIQRP